MIIRAIVDIELKKDGKWVITSLESLDTPPKSTAETKRITVKEHFRNLRKVREERRKNAKGNSSPKHCSECGKIHRNILTHDQHKED